MDDYAKMMLKNIEDNLSQDQSLLLEYQEALRYEDDPRRMAKYKKEIERQMRSVTKYRHEYEELMKQNAENPSVEAIRIGALLKQAISMLDDLKESQINLHGELIDHIDAKDQRLMDAILSKIDQNQAEEIRAILKSIELNKIPNQELKAGLDELQKSLEEIEQKNINSPNKEIFGNLGRFAEKLKYSNLDSSQKLKYSIPLIPAILSYEGEIELKNGISLRSAWNNLVSKVMSK